jgi:5-(carboxyamino)imidazole ribonucleotide mutase
MKHADGKGQIGRVGRVGRVGIVTGSESDLEIVRKVRDTLGSLGVGCELRVLSAHRSPELTVQYVRSAEARGIEVFVACAGMANHLAGTLAAHTRLPVIGVPLVSGALSGLDSLLSTVQMPPGVPVATVSVDGARNAAFLAARILGIKYPAVRARLEQAARDERLRYEQGLAAAEKAERGEGGRGSRTKQRVVRGAQRTSRVRRAAKTPH